MSKQTIDSPGIWTVKTQIGRVRKINVTKKNGVLGVHFRLLYSFVPVSDFVGVEVVERPAEVGK